MTYPRAYWTTVREKLPKGATEYETALNLLLSEDEDYMPAQTTERARLRELANIHAQLAVASELQQIRGLLSARVVIPTPLYEPDGEWVETKQPSGMGPGDSPQSRTDEA